MKQNDLDKITKFQIGNKAFNLNFLRKKSNVPNFFVLPDSFFSIPTYQEELEKISRNLKKLIPSVDGWAIRSSTVVEDSINGSMAGKFKTVIIKDENELMSGVSAVLQSNDTNLSMGIIIQEFVEADYSGVVFSCDPLTGEQDIIIEVVEGRGENLVAGLVTPNLYKQNNWIINDEKIEINDQIFGEIIKTSNNLRKEFGHEIDMEFCVKSDQLYWLQIRPIISKRKITGKWSLLDQCTEPVPILIQEIDHLGFFNSKIWNTTFINNYPYIQMKNNSGDINVDGKYSEIIDEWDKIEERFEPIFSNIYHDDNLTGYSLNDLVQKMFDLIKFLRECVDIYMNRNWFRIRWEISTKLKTIIEETLVGKVDNIDSELLKLTSGLETITYKKSKALNEIILESKKNNKKISFENYLSNSLNESLSYMIKSFLNDFGYEIPHPVSLHLPILFEMPNDLLDKIEYIRNSHFISNSSEDNSWIEQYNFIKGKLPYEKIDLFTELVNLYRRSIKRTENDDYLLQKGAASIRMVLLSIGDKLKQNGQLSINEDIFHLHLKELEYLISNKNSSIDNLDNRKVEFYISKNLTPMQVINEDFKITSDKTVQSVNILKGLGVSLGQAEGEVFIISNPLDRSAYSNIPINAIVVAPILTPALSYNLISVAAIITEVGGYLSHGAIYARETGIPAIAAVSSALKYLKTGDKVRVNASLGIIEIC